MGAPRLTGQVARRVGQVVAERLTEEPVVALQGPRSVGKSTVLADLARSLGVEVLDLDSPRMREVVQRDPDAYTSGGTPVCIDEYQHVPEILDAIKAELNRDLRPGRYILTGSTRYDALPLAAQSLTGRLHRLPVLPLSQGEIDGVHENLLEVLLTAPHAVATKAPSTTSKDEYIERVVAGGMPIALQRTSTASRERWFDDYVQLVLDRDLREVANVRQREQLPTLMRRLASQTAQVLNVAQAGEGLGINRTTTSGYVRHLEDVFLIRRLEAWGRTLRARVAGTPKVHVIDSGIAARLLRLRPDKLTRRDPASLTEFGHLLETFAVGELIKQGSWLDDVSGYGHWRTHDGDEVDLVIEGGDGSVVAFEVKTAGRVPGSDMRSLTRLRDIVGEAFVAGVALYTGERSYQFDDRLWVLPLDRLWTPIS